MKFHHIGIATNNINETLSKLKKKFNITNISDIIFDSKQNADLCMITIDNIFKIELISGKIVENILKKRQYLYHTCYEVENLDKEINDLLEDGAVMVSMPKEAVLFNNKKVSFLMWDLGLIELLEK